jgi:hypothetical protein
MKNAINVNMTNIMIQLLGTELDGAELFCCSNDIEAWWPDGQGVEYTITDIEKDGCWISSKLLEKEGGTTWDWSDPMFYPYNG